MKKRKDRKGNLLRTGETQRNDGRYQYRYTENGKRFTVYADTLAELRKKEEKIYKAKTEVDNYSEGNITVIELLDRYLAVKKGIKETTKATTETMRNIIAKQPFAQRNIQAIKASDVKLWFIELHNGGLKRGTVRNFKNMLSPAFRMAVEEDILKKNPFDFKMVDIIENDATERAALTPEQVNSFLDFCRTDNILKKHIDIFVVLLETGLRVSELCGLTKQDVDFEKGVVTVNKQLKVIKTEYFILKPKTEKGTRIIPMSAAAKEAFSRIIENRASPKVEKIVNGYGNFILLSKYGNPMIARDVEKECDMAEKRYNKAHPDNPLPHITPHVFRHTFCTNLARLDINVKALQYLMGHSDASLTMNVYTHKNFEHALEQFNKCQERLNKSS